MGKPKIKGRQQQAPQSIRARWEKYATYGYCGACSSYEAETMGRWILVLDVGPTRLGLCINHANALHAQMGALLDPIKLEGK